MTDESGQLQAQFAAWSSEDLLEALGQHDEDEWRPEAFEAMDAVLKSRGIAPGEATDRRPGEPERLEAGRTVAVARYLSPTQYHIFRTALEKAGIRTWVGYEAPNVIRFGTASRLLVSVVDEAAAREILEDRGASAAGLQAELGEPLCPACGARSDALEAARTPEAPAAVEELLDNLVDAWNRRDADAFAALFAPSADYITGDGGWVGGREGIQRLFRTPSGTGVASIDGVASIRRHGDVSTVLFGWRLESPAGVVLQKGLTLCVATRAGSGWLIDRMQTTDSAERPRP